MRGSILATMMVVALMACDDGDDDTGPTPETYVATLNGAAERPTPTNSTATGSGTLRVNANRTITYDLAVNGMTPTAQHIHGPIGANGAGPVIIGVTVANNQTITPTSTFATANYDSLLVLLRNGNAYFNIHSATFPAGEIRGNLTRQ